MGPTSGSYDLNTYASWYSYYAAALFSGAGLIEIEDAAIDGQSAGKADHHLVVGRVALNSNVGHAEIKASEPTSACRHRCCGERMPPELRSRRW